VFQQSILSSEESRRPWTFSVSLLAQALFIAIAVLIPLLAKPMLPALTAAIVSLQTPKPPRAVAPPPEQIAAVRPQTFSQALRQPTQMPDRAAALADTPAPSLVIQGIGPVAGPSDTVISDFLDHVHIAPPTAPVSAPEPEAAPLRVSGGVQAAKIIKRVVPIYPPLAIAAHVSGGVRLQAIIAADGSIAELNVISGHPLLVKAAVDAVRQWRYRPTVFGGKPVPVDTQIDVNFTLGR
jgi:periplasmic protein TonB